MKRIGHRGATQSCVAPKHALGDPVANHLSQVKSVAGCMVDYQPVHGQLQGARNVRRRLEIGIADICETVQLRKYEVWLRIERFRFRISAVYWRTGTLLLRHPLDQSLKGSLVQIDQGLGPLRDSKIAAYRRPVNYPDAAPR